MSGSGSEGTRLHFWPSGCGLHSLLHAFSGSMPEERLGVLVFLGLWSALLLARTAGPAFEEELPALLLRGLWFTLLLLAWLGQNSKKTCVHVKRVVFSLWSALFYLLARIAGPASAADLPEFVGFGLWSTWRVACMAGRASVCAGPSHASCPWLLVCMGSCLHGWAGI